MRADEYKARREGLEDALEMVRRRISEAVAEDGDDRLTLKMLRNTTDCDIIHATHDAVTNEIQARGDES